VRITVVASMRNEGPFIVEWVAWYRMLGFTDVVVVTNNCTDRSPELLDALQAAGWVHHMRHDVPRWQRITHQKLEAATKHKAVRRADWALVCDVDEFLVIHKGGGKIADLIGHKPDDVPFLGMVFNWRVFGTGGVEAFQDLPVHQQFSQARSLNKRSSCGIKVLHRQPRWFQFLGEHGPRGWDLERYGRSPKDPDMYLVNAKGEKLTRWSPAGPRYMRTLAPPRGTHEGAQMNHYMLRSAETYSLKAHTLAPVGLSNRYTQTYFNDADAGREPDMSAFHYAEEFAAVQAAAMALPGVARLHKLCCADHLRLIAEKHGRAVEEDQRWHDFLAEAEALA
jgi:hypothetical protein